MTAPAPEASASNATLLADCAVAPFFLLGTRRPRPHRKSSRMPTIHRGSTYKDETVSLDDSSYENCAFIRCRLVYSGIGPVTLSGCQFDNCSFNFEGAAANAVAFINALAAIPACVRLFHTLSRTWNVAGASIDIQSSSGSVSYQRAARIASAWLLLSDLPPKS